MTKSDWRTYHGSKVQIFRTDGGFGCIVHGTAQGSLSMDIARTEADAWRYARMLWWWATKKRRPNG